MEFDKSRVFTALNADELKPGSKVIVADSFEVLKTRVRTDYNSYILARVREENYEQRFELTATSHWLLAYLVEEPEEKKLKVSDLKVHDVLKHKTNNVVYSVEGIDYDNNSVFFGGDWSDDEDLGRCWEKVEK